MESLLQRRDEEFSLIRQLADRRSEGDLRARAADADEVYRAASSRDAFRRVAVPRAFHSHSRAVEAGDLS